MPGNLRESECRERERVFFDQALLRRGVFWQTAAHNRSAALDFDASASGPFV